MINFKNIKTGTGTAILVTSLAIGIGLSFFNGDNYISEADKSDGFAERKTIVSVENFDFNHEESLFIVPEPIEKYGVLGLKVPTGYKIINTKNLGENLDVIEFGQDYEIYMVPSNRDLKDYLGISLTNYRILTFKNSVRESIKNGVKDDSLYISLEHIVNDDGTFSLIVPNGYNIYYAGEASDPFGLSEVELSGESKLITNMNLLATKDSFEVHVNARLADLKNYVGIPARESKLLSSSSLLEAEMEDFCNGLQGKSFN